MEEAWTEIILSATPDLHAPMPPNAGLLNRNPACAGDLGPAPAASSVMVIGPSRCREQSKPFFLTASPNSLLLDSTSSSSSSLLNSFPMKQSSNSENSKLKRKMKNRKSAARSRERGMAYIFAMEGNKLHLTEENERLRKEIQIQQVLQPAAATNAPKEQAHKKLSRCKSIDIELVVLVQRILYCGEIECQPFKEKLSCLLLTRLARANQTELLTCLVL
ncbi:hypothetical protein V2J09_023915 [Rumex salicifolius]